MRKGKGKAVGIILIIMLIALIGILGVYIYLQTDMFKSDSQLFYKYALQNTELLKIRKNDELGTKYETNAKVNFELSSQETNLQIPLRNFSIDYNAKTDKISDIYSRASNFKVFK